MEVEKSSVINWLSIKDNPPKKRFSEVLVANESISTVAAYDPERNVFYNVFNNLYLEVEDVSYWMHLPKPSKQKEI